MATQSIESTTTPMRRGPRLKDHLGSESGLVPYILVFPTLLIIVVIAVYPILNSIWLSFQRRIVSGLMAGAVKG